MREDFTYIGFVLDRSGSMEAVREATIQAFNEFVTDQKTIPGKAHLYLAQFDDVYELVCDVDLQEAEELTAAKYVPRHSTALYDAMGKTILHLGNRFNSMLTADCPSKVVLVTLTDGLENASREYTREKLADMIKHQRDIYSWEFVFLGANQDAVMTGERLNIPARAAMTFNATPKSVRRAVQAMSAPMRALRASASNKRVPMRFSDTDRRSVRE